MNKFIKLLSTIALSCSSIIVHAQTATPEPTDLMHSNGKIYVVVAVLVTIVIGIFVYLINLDRKSTKLEKM